MDRAPDFESEGRRFESYRAYQLRFQSVSDVAGRVGVFGRSVLAVAAGGPLAQLAEHQTLNLRVRGSIPRRLTKFVAGAKVAELADALDLGSSGETHAGSSPAFRTILRLSRSPSHAGLVYRWPHLLRDPGPAGACRPMKATVLEPTPSKRTLEVEIPAEEVEKERCEVARKYAKGASVPGFRKGKTPTAVIRRRFAKEIQEEVVESLTKGSTWSPK